jgi:hypothetical protein
MSQTTKEEFCTSQVFTPANNSKELMGNEPSYQIFKTCEGIPNLIYKLNGEDRLSINSENPYLDIDLIINKIPENFSGNIIIFGFVFGYLASELLISRPNLNKIYIFEPSKSNFTDQLSVLNSEKLLSNSKIEIYAENDLDLIANKIVNLYSLSTSKNQACIFASFETLRIVYKEVINKILQLLGLSNFSANMLTNCENLKINLGAGDRNVKDFLSVDIDPVYKPDFVCDLTKTWPWLDSTVDTFYAKDVFEHLPDKRHSMNELWRVLKVGGTATLKIPHATLGDGGHCDPTHCSYWTASDFEYYTPYDGFGKPMVERFKFRESSYYGIKADFKILNLNDKGHIPLLKYNRRYGGTVYEISVVLQKIIF